MHRLRKGTYGMRSIPLTWPPDHWRTMLAALGAGAAAVILFAATAITSERIEAQDGPILSIDPASQTVELGSGPFEVRFMVENVTSLGGLGGYTLAIAYDPTILRGLAITDSGFLESTDNLVICPASAIDNDAGKLAHFCFTLPILSQIGPQAPGAQVLASVSFEPIREGATTLDITETSITDPSGNVLAATTSNGQVAVGLSAGQETSTTSNPTVLPDDIDLPESGTASGGSDRTILYIVLPLVAAGAIAIAAMFAILRMRNRPA